MVFLSLLTNTKSLIHYTNAYGITARLGKEPGSCKLNNSQIPYRAGDIRAPTSLSGESLLNIRHSVETPEGSLVLRILKVRISLL